MEQDEPLGARSSTREGNNWKGLPSGTHHPSFSCWQDRQVILPSRKKHTEAWCPRRESNTLVPSIWWSVSKSIFNWALKIYGESVTPKEQEWCVQISWLPSVDVQWDSAQAVTSVTFPKAGLPRTHTVAEPWGNSRVCNCSVWPGPSFPGKVTAGIQAEACIVFLCDDAIIIHVSSILPPTRLFQSAMRAEYWRHMKYAWARSTSPCLPSPITSCTDTPSRVAGKIYGHYSKKGTSIWSICVPTTLQSTGTVLRHPYTNSMAQ